MSNTGADDVFNVKVHTDSDGSEDQYADVVADALVAAFKAVAPQMSRVFANTFKKASTQASGITDVFKNAERDAEAFGTELRDVHARLSALHAASKAAGGSFGKDFDPDNLKEITSALEQLIRLQNEFAKTPPASAAARQAARDRTNLIKAETTAARIAAQQSTLAARERLKQEESTRNRASREKIAAQRAESSKLVIDTQAASARELAVIRSNAAQQVAITKSAAAQRAAAYELIGRAARSTERVIRSAFDGTANVVSSAFQSIRRGAQNVSNSVRQTFTTQNQAINASVRNSNQQISNSYRSTWRRNTSTVNNELNQQETRIRQFSREATEEISSIGVGRMAGFAALGVAAGRALTSGYTRAANIEDADRALTQLLGSAEQAVDLRNKILEIVQGTPFDLSQFAGAAAQLVAFNFEASKIPSLLETIGNAAAVRGGDANETIDRLVRTFGQITAAGRVMTEDLNQLTEAGVPALRILGNAFGKSGIEMRKMVEEGAVPANEAIDILIAGIQNGSNGVNGATVAFDGLAKSLGSTLRGSVANFNIAFARLGAGIITKFSPLFVKMLATGTAAIDGLGSAFASLADSIVASPVFAVIERLFTGMADRIKAAVVVLKPAFGFIADGLVAFGTAAAGVAGIKQLPALFNLITFAIGRLLTPMNLLVTAGILVGGFVTRLVRENPTLAASFSALGDALGRVFTVIKELASDGLDALTGVIANYLTPAVDFLADKIVDVAIPAIAALSDFILTKVLPPIRRFARMIREDVLPVLGTAFATAVNFVREQFGNLVDFIQDEVIPTVGPYLKTAVETGRNAFASAYEYLSGTFVPFVKGNLIPVLGGLAAALGVLSLGGGLGLAGLAAGGGLIVAALTNDNIRTKIVTFFEDTVQQVREKFAEMIDGGLVGDIIKGVLGMAKKIGRVLGDALSDRRLLTGLGAVAAGAVAIGASFALGFAEGVVKNIPELLQALSDGLTAGFKKLASSSGLVKAVVGIFAGAAVLAAVARSGKQISETFTNSVKIGPMKQQAGGVGGFASALFGGSGAIAKTLDKEMKATQVVAQREARRLQAIMRTATGSPTNLMAQGAGGRFTKDLDVKKIAAEYDKVTASMTKASLAGAQVKAGIGQAISAIKSGNPTLATFQDGLRSIGEGLRNAGPALGQFAQKAGIAVGASFAGAFLAQAAFDIESTGSQKLQGVVGALGSGLAAGMATGNVAVGVGVSVVSLLGGAFLASKEQADRLKQSIKELAAELRGLSGDDVQAAIDKDVLDAFLEQSDTVKQTLEDINVEYDAFAEAAANGRGIELLAQKFAGLGPIGQKFAEDLRSGELTLGRIDEAILNAGAKDYEAYEGIASEIEEAGFKTKDFANATGFLGEQIKVVDGALKTAALDDAISDTAGARVKNVADQYATMNDRIRLSGEATATFREKLDELNDAKIDAAKQQVDDAKSALDNARDAAGRAKDALVDFLTGNTAEKSIGQITDQAALDIFALGDSITSTISSSLGEGATIGANELATTIRSKVQEAKDAAGEILRAGDYTNQADAAAALQPLLDAALEVGGQAGTDITTGINEVLANFNTVDGQKLVTEFLNVEEAVAEAQAGLDTAESYLNFRAQLDPETVPNLLSEARAAALEVNLEFANYLGSDTDSVSKAGQNLSFAGADAAGGKPSLSAWQTSAGNLAAAHVSGIDGSIADSAAAGRALALAGSGGATGTEDEWSSGGTLMSGVFSEGISGGTVGAETAARGMAGKAATAASGQSGAMETAGYNFASGFKTGIENAAQSVANAAAAIARRARDTVSSTLRIESPSKVMIELGQYFGEGFGEGITESQALVIKAAVDLAKKAVKGLSNALKGSVNAIGEGLAEAGPSFIASISSAMDEAFIAASTQAERFRAIGTEIGRNLFQNQGTNAFGASNRTGGPVEANLALAQLSLQQATQAFGAMLRERVAETTAFFGGNAAAGRAFGADFGVQYGAENRAQFIEAGLDIREYVDQLLAAGRSTQEAADAARVQRDQLIRMAQAAGANTTVLNELITLLGLSNTQIDAWVASVNATTAATTAATAAEQARIAAEAQAETNKKAQEDADAAAAERDRTQSLPPQAFRDLIIQTPSGDPEAVALATVNRVASRIRPA